MDSKDSSNNPESKPESASSTDPSGWDLPNPNAAPELGPPGNPWGTPGAPAADWDSEPAQPTPEPRQARAATVLEANSADLIAAAMAQAEAEKNAAPASDPAFAKTGDLPQLDPAPDASGWGVSVTPDMPTIEDPPAPRQARAATVLEANSADLIAAAMAQAESQPPSPTTNAPSSGFGAPSSPPPSSNWDIAPPSAGFGATPPPSSSPPSSPPPSSGGFGSPPSSNTPPSNTPPSSPPPSNPPPQQGQNLPTAPQQVAMTAAEIENGKTLAIVSHAICFIPLFIIPMVQKDNRFALFHAKQAVISFAAFWGLFIVGSGAGFMCLPLPCIFYLLAFVPGAIGAYWAYSGEAKMFPEVGEFVDNLLEDVQVDEKK